MEINSPQIIGADREIWLNLIKRDIPNWNSKPHEPTNPKNWWKVYRKLKQEAQDDSNQDAEKLKAAFANIKNEKEQSLAAHKARRDVPPPDTEIKTRIIQTYVKRKGESKEPQTSGLIKKIRKEIGGTKNGRMAVPTKDLKKQASIVMKAPKDFLEEARKLPQRTVHISPPRQTVRAAAPPLVVSRLKASSNDRSFPEQEARLRALTSVGELPKQVVTPISSLDGPPDPPALGAGTRRRQIREPERPPQSLNQSTTSRPRPSAHSRDPGLSVRDPMKAAGSVPHISGRGATPQPSGTKRKAPPSVFMETKRPKATSSALVCFEGE